MPTTLEVFDRWRSSTPSCSSPILFEMCEDGTRLERLELDKNIIASASTAADANKSSAGTAPDAEGGWQGGDYGAMLDDAGLQSCDSSLGAWSEDGHRTHMENRKKKSTVEAQREWKRSSAVVYGALLTYAVSPSVAGRRQVLSPGQGSETHSSPFASPLCKFPAAPARGSAGRLLPICSPPPMLTTPRDNTQPIRNAPQGADVHLPRSVCHPSPQNTTLDTPRLEESGWTVEPIMQHSPVERTTALIDSLIMGMQTGVLGDGMVRSPDGFQDDEDDEGGSQGGWETEECDITPRLRPVWQEERQSSDVTPSPTVHRQSGAASATSQHRHRSVSTKAPAGRQLSFIRVPSAIFPHTPAKRLSGKGKRTSTLSMSSTSSRLSTVSSVASAQRRVSRFSATPSRALAHKSRYYSRTSKSSDVAAVRRQHLMGARGKFWSPMNSVCLLNVNLHPPTDAMPARESSRYLRRSGQDWVRPRTFEVKNQYRVTIYPPRPDEFFQKRQTGLAQQKLPARRDPDKTPTQADFRALAVAVAGSSSVKTSRGVAPHRLPPHPPPKSSPPPVPLLNYADKGRKSVDGGRRSASQLGSACSQCCSFSPTCSCSLTESPSTASESTHSSDTGTYTCSCSSHSGMSGPCSCTTTDSKESRSDFGSIQAPSSFGSRTLTSKRTCPKESYLVSPPRSASHYTSASQRAAAPWGVAPHSAPYYSSQAAPVLDPLPFLSPFRIDFESVLGWRMRSKAAFDTADCSSVVSRSDSTGSHTWTTTGVCTNELNSHSITKADSESYDSYSTSKSSSVCSGYDSEQDSYDAPLTPPRSEYQSSHAESPGTRISFIVSPMPQRAKRFSQLQNLLNLSPPAQSCPSISIQQNDDPGPTAASDSGAPSVSSFDRSLSRKDTRRVPRSILKTSRCTERDYDEVNSAWQRRPAATVSMAANTVTNSGISFYKSSLAHRATLATSTMTKHDLESRIQREENRRKRNESRLYALEKLEGKTKKSSLFSSLLSTTSGGIAPQAKGWDEEEDMEDLDATPLPQTPLTPAKEHLLELQHQLERRQRLSHFQDNKAVSFTDVIGFDMGTYPKVPIRKRLGGTAGGDAYDQDSHALKLQIKKLGTAIEARQYAKDKCIDK